MELTDNGEGFVDIVDMGQDIPENIDILPANYDLEVSDALPGAKSVPIKEDKVEKPTNWENDGDHKHFIVWLRKEVQNLPSHSGETTVGCERVLSRLRKLDKELSRAVSTDHDNVIDEIEAERLRDTIMDFQDKLEVARSELLEKKKKTKKAYVRFSKQIVARIKDGKDIGYYMSVSKGDDEELLPISLAEPSDEQVQKFVEGEADNSLVKEAGMAPIYLFEDPFLHSITRILINAHTSAGRDIEKVYAKLKEKYSFTKREELSIQELLLQKGMPIYKDFGRLGEPADPADDNGIEFSTVYQA